MSSQLAVVLFGLWNCLFALIVFVSAGLMVRVLAAISDRVVKTSGDFEFARIRLGACLVAACGLGFVALGAFGGSLSGLVDVTGGRWWKGHAVLAGALVLIFTRERLAMLLARPSVPLLYRALEYEQRRRVLSAVLLGFGLFLGWTGIVITSQLFGG